MTASLPWRGRRDQRRVSVEPRSARSSASPTGSSTTGPGPTCCGRRSWTPRVSGSQRRYSYGDVLELKVIKRLLDAGLKLQQARQAVECLRGDLGVDLGSAQLVLGRQPVDPRHLRRRGGRPPGRWSGCVQRPTPVGCGVRTRSCHRGTHGVDCGCGAGRGRTGRTAPGSCVPRSGRVRPTVSPGRLQPPAPTTGPGVRFAHESEQRFARILDFYGVEWEYEPVEFVLDWGNDLRPSPPPSGPTSGCPAPGCSWRSRHSTSDWSRRRTARSAAWPSCTRKCV